MVADYRGICDMENVQVTKPTEKHQLSIHQVAKTQENIAGLIGAFSEKAAPLNPLTVEQIEVVGELFAIVHDGEIVAYVSMEKVTRCCGTVEAAIRAASGGIKGIDLVATVLPELEKLAKKAGCTSMMFETKRRGLMAKSAKQGYRESSRIFRKKL